MVNIQRGMTPEQVVDRIGPPLDRIDLAGLFGDSAVSMVTSGGRGGLLSRLLRRRTASPVRIATALGNSVSWYYQDFPTRGQETMISFVNGVVTEVRSRHSELPERTGVEHEWAEDLIMRHVARVARVHPDARLAALPNWQRLTSPEVLDFVLNVHAFPAEGEEGRLPCRARRFGDLDVLVSMLPVTEPEEIRELLPDGYLPALGNLLRDFGIRPDQTDVAHWILCRSDDGSTLGNLCYLPADRDITALTPWSLLSPEEQQRGSKSD